MSCYDSGDFCVRHLVKYAKKGNVMEAAAVDRPARPPMNSQLQRATQKRR